MSLALEAASQDQGEVPVGAVIVYNQQLLAKAGNQREQSNDPTAHAEIVALREASAIALYMSPWNRVRCAWEPS